MRFENERLIDVLYFYIDKYRGYRDAKLITIMKGIAEIVKNKDMIIDAIMYLKSMNIETIYEMNRDMLYDEKGKLIINIQTKTDDFMINMNWINENYMKNKEN